MRIEKGLASYRVTKKQSGLYCTIYMCVCVCVCVCVCKSYISQRLQLFIIVYNYSSLIGTLVAKQCTRKSHSTQDATNKNRLNIPS